MDITQFRNECRQLLESEIISNYDCAREIINTLYCEDDEDANIVAFVQLCALFAGTKVLSDMIESVDFKYTSKNISRQEIYQTLRRCPTETAKKIISEINEHFSVKEEIMDILKSDNANGFYESINRIDIPDTFYSACLGLKSLFDLLDTNKVLLMLIKSFGQRSNHDEKKEKLDSFYDGLIYKRNEYLKTLKWPEQITKGDLEIINNVFENPTLSNIDNITYFCGVAIETTICREPLNSVTKNVLKVLLKRAEPHFEGKLFTLLIQLIASTENFINKRDLIYEICPFAKNRILPSSEIDAKIDELFIQYCPNWVREKKIEEEKQLESAMGHDADISLEESCMPGMKTVGFPDDECEQENNTVHDGYNTSSCNRLPTPDLSEQQIRKIYREMATYVNCTEDDFIYFFGYNTDKEPSVEHIRWLVTMDDLQYFIRQIYRGISGNGDRLPAGIIEKVKAIFKQKNGNDYKSFGTSTNKSIRYKRKIDSVFESVKDLG